MSRMNIVTLCDGINLQPEIKSRVLAFAGEYDFRKVDRLLKDFFVYSGMETARREIEGILGEDPDKLKMLACMMRASTMAYEVYREKGIDDEIYFATMKCLPRFLEEARRKTGSLCFDRDWWTVRQAGCHLFRIGALEYERIPQGDQVRIELHIPSDADFSPGAVDDSLERAKEFFGKHFSEDGAAEYRCQSWLLDGRLREMLGEGSHILDFQSRFEITDTGEESTEFIEWVFRRDAADWNYRDFPEETSLQRKLKRLLLAGGKLRNASGKIEIGKKERESGSRSGFEELRKLAEERRNSEELSGKAQVIAALSAGGRRRGQSRAVTDKGPAPLPPGASF